MQLKHAWGIKSFKKKGGGEDVDKREPGGIKLLSKLCTFIMFKINEYSILIQHFNWGRVNIE